MCDLFDVDALKLPCKHHVRVGPLTITKNEYLGRENTQSKLEREKKLTEKKVENAFRMMGGFMSAKGQMGITKYQGVKENDPQHFAKVYHIADDLQNKRQRSCDDTAKRVKLMEERSINRTMHGPIRR